MEARQDNRAGPKRPSGNGEKLKPHKSFDSPWSPPILGEEARKDQPQRIICATTKPRLGPQSTTAGGDANEADGRLRPRPPGPEKLQKRPLGAGSGNGSAVLEFI